MNRTPAATLLALALSVSTPHILSAQSVTSGTIAGVVKDATGGVLPGVTVEASSPALIEKTRTGLTDAGGQYKLIELRPGTYVVTFSLPGFRTVKRDGVELTTGFTATVNADLVVGAVAETVIVSGSSPVVDTRNVRRQDVFSSEKMAVLPTSKALTAFAALTAGVTMASTGVVMQDVGGSFSENSTALMMHNSRGGDSKEMLDGMTLQWALGTAGGSSKIWYSNPALYQEVTMETSGIGAETETAGVQVNMVPKDGGNTFRGVVIGNYTDHHLQSNNLDDELEARGLLEQAKTKRVYDENVGVGGPVMKDRLWFFFSQRRNRAENFVAGNYFNKTLHTLFYTPDLSRQAYVDELRNDLSTRVTWQAAAKHKITFYQGFQRTCSCFQSVTSARAPESAYSFTGKPLRLTQATWTYPATNRLLVQAGVGYSDVTGQPLRPIDGTEQDIAVTDNGLGYTYGAYAGLNIVSPGRIKAPAFQSRVSASYVTGSHAFKAGVFTYRGHDDIYSEVNNVPGLGTVQYTFLNQRPISVNYFASPLAAKDNGANLGLYGQDQWTIKRLTLNLGVRFDYLRQWYPDQTAPASLYTPALSIAEKDVSNWKDVSPRLGVAFDLFGNGRTAFKGSVGRYVIGDNTTLAQAVNPSYAISRSASRTWTDDGDYVPEANELGPLSNSAFGTPVVNTNYDPAVLNGWYVRPYQWQVNALVQHELRPGMGLMFGFFRTSYGAFRATDNLRIGPASFDPYCVTVATDARMPGGGGNQVCGYQDIQPASFGRVQNLVTSAETFGEMTEVYNGVDVSLNSRFGRGGLFTASFNTGQTTTNNCLVVDNPAGVQPAGAGRPGNWCETTNPFSGQTQLKLSGSYPLPKEFAVSGVFQSLPGIPITATQTFTNAQILPTLGRNLGACGVAAPVGQCGATATVNVIEPFTQFEPRLEQLDLRLSKMFRFGRARLQAQADVYNLLNANNVLSINGSYGSQWLKPLQVLGARTFKFGGQLDF